MNMSTQSPQITTMPWKPCDSWRLNKCKKRNGFSTKVSNFMLSPSLGMQKAFVLLFILVLLLQTIPVTAMGTDSVSSHQTNHKSPSEGCYRHFGHRIQRCLDPFLEILTLYDSKVHVLKHPLIVAKHICLEYEMVLLCLHSSLTDCPTVTNLRRVQAKLDSAWVTRINDMCAIQSKQSTQVETHDFRDLTNYIYKQKLTNKLNSYEIAQQIIKESSRTRAELENDIVELAKDDAFHSTLVQNRRRQPPTFREEVSNLRQTEQHMNLNIVNLIENYNSYQTNNGGFDGRHDTTPSRVRLVHREYTNSSSTTRSYYFVHLLIVCIVFFKLCFSVS